MRNVKIIEIELTEGLFYNMFQNNVSDGRTIDEAKLKKHLQHIEDVICELNAWAFDPSIKCVCKVNGYIYSKHDVMSVLGIFRKLLYPGNVTFDGTEDYETLNLREGITYVKYLSDGNTAMVDHQTIELSDKCDPVKLEAAVRAVYAMVGKRDLYSKDAAIINTVKLSDVNLADENLNVCLNHTGLPIYIEGFDLDKFYKPEYVTGNVKVAMKEIYSEVANFKMA